MRRCDRGGSKAGVSDAPQAPPVALVPASIGTARTTPSSPAGGRSGASPPRRPQHLRWFWSMTVNGPMTRSDKVATLEEAKAQFQKSWDAWKAWASWRRRRSVRR